MPSRILVIEDEPANIQTLSTLLKERGYQINIATNGGQALQVLERIRPDLILLDIMMPEMDGFETCRRIKASTTWREIPIVFLTAKTDTGDIVRAFELGAVDYVAGLGGGVVEIGEGEYLMRDSLHLRPNVTVQGQGNATVLRKAKSAASALKLDGDYGEEQFTVENAEGFEVGDGVAIWDKNSGGGFHTTVARITGRPKWCKMATRRKPKGSQPRQRKRSVSVP